MNPVLSTPKMHYFYLPTLTQGSPQLEDEEFQHCIKVLRHQPGDTIGLMDGLGNLAEAILIKITGKTAHLEISRQWTLPAKPFRHHLAIAPTKNIDRMEWMLEKACELGLDEITFFQSQNSERGKLRTDRLEKKAISALKQSKSGYLTQIHPLTDLDALLQSAKADTRYIAVVQPDLPYFSTVLAAQQSVLTLIGPEGDFTEAEVVRARDAGFIPISLGHSVLRTETAGLMACHFVNVVNGW